MHAGVVTPFPWHFCARVIGSKVEFKVWPVAEPLEPAWGDPTHGGSAMLPAGWSARGRRAGSSATSSRTTPRCSTNLATYKWVDPPA